MARTTKNRQITQLDSGAHRDIPFNAPALETENARLEQFGVFRKANVAASSSAVLLTLGGVDSDALGVFVAGRAGKIMGIVWNWSTVPTAGTASLQALKNATGVGDSPSVLAVRGVVDETTPVDFAEGDQLTIAVTTNAGFLPITADLEAWLMIRWAP